MSARRRALLMLALTAPLFIWALGQARLMAFDQRWPEAEASERALAHQRDHLAAALSRLHLADRTARLRCDQLAAALTRRLNVIEPAERELAVHDALLAALRVSGAEYVELRDARAELLGWGGHARQAWVGRRLPPAPTGAAAVRLLDVVPQALVAQRRLRVESLGELELALYRPLDTLLADPGLQPVDDLGPAIILRAADGPGGLIPGMISERLESSAGETWWVSAPRASRDVARRGVEHEARLLTLCAIAALVLCGLALLGRFLLRSTGGTMRKLAIWTIAVMMLAIGFDRFEAYSGWLSLLPDTLDGEPFYSDADHRLGRFTQSPLALLLSNLALLGWLMGCRRIATNEERGAEGAAATLGAPPTGPIAPVGGRATDPIGVRTVDGISRIDAPRTGAWSAAEGQGRLQRVGQLTADDGVSQAGATHIAPPTSGPDRRYPARLAGLLSAVLAVVLSLGLLALFALEVRSVVRFSYDVELFPDDRVVPAVPALVLEVGLLLGALLVLLGGDLLTRAALIGLRGIGATWTHRPLLLCASLAIGLPWLPGLGGWSLGLTTYLIALVAFTGALYRGLRGYGDLARALVVLLGAGALLFPALSRQLRNERLDFARAKAEAGFDRGEAVTLLAVRLQSALEQMGQVVSAAPAGWAATEDAAFELWRGQQQSIGARALIRLLDEDGVIESRFEIGMPPPDWYFAPLDRMQDEPDGEEPAVLRLRRGRFELTMLAQVRTLRLGDGSQWRVLLALPLVDDPLLPTDADPGLRLPAPLPGDVGRRELMLRREANGRLRSPLPIGTLRLPAVSAGELVQVHRQLSGGPAELFVRGESDGASLVVGVPLPDAATLFVDYVRLLLILVAVAALALPLILARRLRRRVGLGLVIERRLLGAFGVLSILPLAWLAVFSAQRDAAAIEQAVRARMASDLVQLRALVVDKLDAAGGDLDSALHGVDGALAAARRQGMTLLVYRQGLLIAQNRPGMVRTGILPVRPPARVQRDLIHRSADRRFAMLARPGDASLPVVYGALRDPANGAPLAVLATVSRAAPDALLREQTRTTRVAVAVYGLTLLAVLLLGMVIARRISRPVEALLEGTRQIAAGHLEHQISYPARDEFGELIDSFNAMTSQVRLLQEQRVDAGRSEVMSTMARQIAHEIKNPLTPMKLAAQHLRDAYDRQHERFPEILDKTTTTVIEQVDALHRIASAFSTYSRFPDRELQGVDVEALLEEVAVMYDGYEDRIEVIRRFNGGLPQVKADRDELRRVFINLATNAVQAIEGPGRLVWITGRSLLEPIDSRGVRAGEPRPCIEVKLIDSGAGITPENLSKIFVPNFSTKTSGTGLGLPICRKAVHALGGSMSIESRVGEGTTVSVSLLTIETPK